MLFCFSLFWYILCISIIICNLVGPFCKALSSEVGILNKDLLKKSTSTTFVAELMTLKRSALSQFFSNFYNYVTVALIDYKVLFMK